MAELYRGDHRRGEIEILATNVVFKNAFVTLFNDDVLFPGGVRGTYIRLSSEWPDGAVVLPLLPECRVGLVRVFRHALRQWYWELPRGAAMPGESPAECAERELREETGWSAVSLTHLGTVAPDASIFGGTAHLFLANVDASAEFSSCPERSEGIEALSVRSLGELQEMIVAGEIVDAYSIVCFCRAQLHLGT